MATYLGHQEDSSGNILLPTPHSMATQIEFGTKASQAYAKGAYVVFNNRLCKASKAIASGNTLAIGTNLVQCSIGSELNSHLQAPNGNEFYFDYKDGKPGFYPSASKVASEFVPFGGSSEITLVAQAESTSVAYIASSGNILMVIVGSQYSVSSITINALSTETEQIFYDTHGTYFAVRVAKVGGSGTASFTCGGSAGSGGKYIAVYKLE